MTIPNECPKCRGSIIMVEYSLLSPEYYDGISEYQCSKNCGYRVGRWSGKLLKAGEIEKRFGRDDDSMPANTK